VSSAALLVRAVLDGVGVGYTIESYVASHLAAGRLVPLLGDWSLEHHSYYLYYSGRRPLPAPLNVFTAFLRHAARAIRFGFRCIGEGLSDRRRGGVATTTATMARIFMWKC